ncbi:hypothetical protein ACU18_10420 [Arthrobacter sp. ZBG10]|nr:hypothetical protein ACU18_10420 [Arthrobacter sp. ZBG10]
MEIGLDTRFPKASVHEHGVGEEQILRAVDGQAVLGATIEQRRLVDEMTTSLHDSMVIGVGALAESRLPPSVRS